ncbi:hypothetical protein BGZ81_007384 [Podila clonocystis]|nr:hypothetical protein BGZ81_007384 [Podila clonocystis]
MPDTTVMSKTKSNDEEKEQQYQGQESDDGMDWRGEEEESGNTDQEVEMEGTETEDVEMEGPKAEEAEMEEATAWSIRDLYHGLVPHDLVKGWKHILGASTWVAQ